MNRLRLWILGTALGSFAAGMNVGLVAPRYLLAAEELGTGVAKDAPYVAKLVADYQLSPAQARSVRYVMQELRREEFDIFDRAEAAQLPPEMQRPLLKARGRSEERIRAVLDEEQRTRYDRATRPK